MKNIFDTYAKFREDNPMFSRAQTTQLSPDEIFKVEDDEDVNMPDVTKNKSETPELSDDMLSKLADLVVKKLQTTSTSTSQEGEDNGVHGDS